MRLAAGMLDAELLACIPPKRGSQDQRTQGRGSPTQREAAAAPGLPVDSILADVQGDLAKGA